MDDVAAQLVMSKRTLYELFDDKEELLYECVKYREEEKLRYLREIGEKADNVLEVVAHYYLQGMKETKYAQVSVIEEIKRYPTVWEYISERHEEATRKAKEFYLTGVEQGMFREDVNFEVFHMLMQLAMDGFFKSGVMNDYSLNEVFDTIIRVNIRGICTEKGIHLFDEFLAKNSL